MGYLVIKKPSFRAAFCFCCLSAFLRFWQIDKVDAFIPVALFAENDIVTIFAVAFVTGVIDDFATSTVNCFVYRHGMI